ncbi:MAG: WG repeat-containing protein, partial [Saprospiraceae bacterium]
PYACGNCTSKGYRIQLSLRAPGGRIAEKIEAFAEGETEKKRLQQAYQWVIPLVYNQIWSYSEGNDHRGYVVQANKTFGWLDELGNILLPPVYRRIERAGGQMMQVDAGNRCFLADSTGKILVDSLDGISTSCGIGEFTQEVKKKGVYLGVDGQGNILYTQKQAGYSSLSDRTRDGKTWMVSGENSGLIQGERVIIPAVYPFFRFLGNGLISAHKDSMGYLFNLDGDTLLSRKGGAIETMSGDFATISREGLFKWKTQQLIYPGQDVGYIMYNWDSAFIYQDDDRYFYLLFNRQGQLLGTFKNVIPGLNGDAVIVTDTVAQLFGIVDFQGKILVQPQYKTLSSLDNGIFIAERENSEGYSYYGLLSTNGEVILPFDCKRLQYLESGKYYLERRVKKTYLQNHWNMPFNSIWLMDLPEDNWYRYEQDLQYGVFDILTRKFTALPPGVTLDYALRYNKGVFLKVKKNDLMGLMDLDLAELVPIAFKEVGPMGRFGVVVSSQGKMGVIKLK